MTAATASGEDQLGAEPHFGFVDQLRLTPLNIRDVCASRAPDAAARGVIVTLLTAAGLKLRHRRRLPGGGGWRPTLGIVVQVFSSTPFWPFVRTLFDDGFGWRR